MGLLEGAVKGKPATIDFRDDVGFRQQLWAVTDPAVLDHVVEPCTARRCLSQTATIAMRPH